MSPSLSASRPASVPERRCCQNPSTYGTTNLRQEQLSIDIELVNFDSPTEVRTFEKGHFELYVSLHIMGSEGYAAA